jgi:hypothetical protein
VFEGLENPNSKKRACVVGRVVLFKWNTISIPTHCPPPNLALHYPKFASMFFLSQRSNHVTKALHLSCEIHNCCFLMVFAYWPFFSFHIGLCVFKL